MNTPHQRLSRLSRRSFIQSTAAATTGLAAASSLAAQREPAQEPEVISFQSQWSRAHDRVWLGPEFWANPLQDWRIANGRIECVNAAPNRNVHVLTRQLSDEPGNLTMKVRVARVGGGQLGEGKGSFGFRIGVRGPLNEYRNSLIFGDGLDVGLTASGGMFAGPLASAIPGSVELDVPEVELALSLEPEGDAYRVTLTVTDPSDGRVLGEFIKSGIPPQRVVGNLALVANFGGTQPRQGRQQGNVANNGRFSFADWRIAGSKLAVHDEQAFGPILFSQYTLSAGTLKLTAQLPPIGDADSQQVRLQLRRNDAWQTVAEEQIHPAARTATFRIDDWDAASDAPYRLACTMSTTDGDTSEHYWEGTVRRDPVDQPVITVADVSCNIHAAFPNHDYVAKMARLNPDFVAFVGDQFYESTGGYGVVRDPLDTAILDYLRKWSMHGWTWRDVIRDRPSISIPDDHDVYQGNIWGEAGAARHGTQEMGGYDMHAEWVNVVHRTQTSHHPDPYDATPVQQNISTYYGPLTYGRISFAILADRMFKTGPEGKVPPTGNRGDHVVDPNFDPKTADLPGLELLGERQMKFLRDWAADWRGADMKAVLSQTIFTAMATTHGGERERLRADYDANGWPQTPRNEALREIRKAFAVHLAGDQHLPAVVHYGIDEHNDAAVAFAGPAVNVGYPRWWEPDQPGGNREPGAPEDTGEFLDHFGNPLTVLAVANGAVQPRKTVLEQLHDKTSGLGLVRFDRPHRRITFECWPFLADPQQPNTQFPGWPVTIDMSANDGRKPAAHLPTLNIHGVENPVVQVLNHDASEIIYTLRIAGQSFQPPVFAAGTYTIRVSEPESGKMHEVRAEASPGNRESLEVPLL